MNIGQANAIPLSDILEKIGCQPTKRIGADVWYLSPFRSEKTASFHIHTGKNVWYDFGEGKGGSAVDFVCAYLKQQHEDHTVVDALRWMQNMTCKPVFIPAYKEKFDDKSTALTAHKVLPLQHRAFKTYLASRGIPLTVAKKYLKEVYVRNHHTGKFFLALGLPNEGGGHELRNKYFQGTIAPKAISFIRGRNPSSHEIHVFEGMMDFLSAVVYQKGGRFAGDAIILNSVSCVTQVLPYIRDYSYKTLYSWTDNDAAGEKTAEVLKNFAAECKIGFKKMNRVYAKHKDVNDWHKHRFNLKPKATLL